MARLKVVEIPGIGIKINLKCGNVQYRRRPLWRIKKNPSKGWCISNPIFSNREVFEWYFKRKGRPVPEVLYWKDEDVKVGCWLLADDGGIAKCLHKFGIKTGFGVKTCVGMFIEPSKKMKMMMQEADERLSKAPYFMDTDLSLHYDRETPTGEKRIYVPNKHYIKLKKEGKYLTYDEFRYAYLVGKGLNEYEAVKKVFPLVSNWTAKVHSLRNKSMVVRVMYEEIKRQVDKLGIKEGYAFEKLKELIEEAEDDNSKLKAIIYMGEQTGDFKPKKILEARANEDDTTGKLGGFKGFKKISETEIKKLPEADVVDGLPDKKSTEPK